MIETSDILFGTLDDSLVPPRYLLLSEPVSLPAVFLDGYGADLGFAAPTPDPSPVVDPDDTGPVVGFTSFIPPSLGLGYVLHNTSNNIMVRNDTPDTWTLTSIVAHDLDGTTYGLITVTLPVILAPGASFLFYCTVPSVGASERVNARLEFVFGIQGTYNFYISGFRNPIFPFRPNWDDPPVERLSWLTDKMLSFAGNETRVSLRQRPRRQLEINVAGLLEDRPYLDSVLVGMQDLRVLFPLWFERQHLLATLPAGSTSVAVSTVDREYAVGGYVLITNGPYKLEVMVIAALTDSLITFDAATGQEFPAHSYISPAFFGTFAPAIAGGSVTPGIATARIIVEFMDLPLYSAVEEGTTFDGKPVSLRSPNRAEDVTVEYKKLRDTLDYEVGQLEFQSRTVNTFNVRSYSYYLKNRAERMAFRKWLAARRGQAVPYLYPIWEHSFTVVNDILFDDTTIIVKNQHFSDFFSVQTIRRYIAIRTIDGAWHFAKISSIDPDTGEGEYFNLVAAFGVAIPVANIVMSTFMEYSVLNADAVEIAYPTDTSSTVKLAVRSVIA